MPREGIVSKPVASLQPGDVLHGSGDTVVKVTQQHPGLYDLKADRRKCVVVTTHPKYGRRVREWNRDTQIGVIQWPDQ